MGYAGYGLNLYGSVCGRCDQVTKSVRWMTWHQEAMKDVVACDKLKGAGKQAVILRFLNGETRSFGIIVT